MRKFRVLLTPLLLLLYWQLIASSGLVSSYLLPPPLEVARSFIELIQSGDLTQHLGASLTRIFFGYLISCTAGILLAALVSQSIILEELLASPLALLRMIPPLAMTPLLILWLGIGNATQLSIIILASFFPIFLNTRDGFRRITAEQKELAKSLALPAKTYWSHFVLPAATPSMVTGARLAFGYSWRALIGSELIAASSGLGYLIIDAQEMQRTDVVMVGILVIGVVGWLLDHLFMRVISKTLGRRFPEMIH